jgi:hypothetical protein
MKYLKLAGTFAAVLAFLLIVAYNWYAELIYPYRWDGPVINEASANGFKLMQRHSGGELYFPWTLVYPYTTHLAFVDPQSIENLRQYKSAEVAWFFRNHRGQIDSWKNVSVFDCAERIFATLADNEGRYEEKIFRSDGGPMKKWWTEMNDQMVQFFCIAQRLP